MIRIAGKLEKIDKESGTSKTGKPYKRWVFHVDNKKYSTFDERIGDFFEVGDTIEMFLEKSGNYLNLQKANKLVGKAAEEAEQEELPKNEGNDVIDLLRKILAELKELNGNNINKKTETKLA